MDEKRIIIKEKILISLIIILIILVPVSLLFETKPLPVKIDNLSVKNVNETTQEVLFSLGNTLSNNIYCKIRVQFYLNNDMIKEEIKNVGLIRTGENVDVNFILNIPDGESIFRLRPECSPIYEFP